jgi:hypothetical protein
MFSLFKSLVKLDTIKLGLIDAVIIFGWTILLQELGIASRHFVIEGLRDSDSRRTVEIDRDVESTKQQRMQEKLTQDVEGET